MCCSATARTTASSVATATISISGGTGDDGIIGDDGRISISRNSLSADPSSVGYLVSTGEPLNGIPPLLPSDLNKTTNLSGALKVTFNLTPVNVRGTDSAIFAGMRSAYTLTDLGGGSALVSGPNGLDTLASVERLVFDDQTVIWPPEPDLIVSSITPAVTTVAQGSNLSFSYVIKNQGGVGAGLNYSSWLVDSKPTVGSGSVWDTINSLAAGATASFTDSISTSGLSVGTHTLWVDADNWNNVAESTETNNWNSVTFTVTAPPQPDLIVSSITPNATSVTQGSTFSFSYVVKDIGTAAAGSSWAGIYLDGQSASNELSGSAGYNSIAGMAANGGFVTASNSFGTAGLSVGQHTMWIKADYYNNLVSESDETNNWKSVTFNVTAPPLPDLVVNSITPNATSVTQGSTFSFSYVVKDIGTAAAGSSWAGIYLDGQSASNELSGSAGYNSIAGMAANGGFVTASNSFGTAGLSVGQHTLWIKADYYNNLISEGDETNNWKSVTFSVTAPPLPDLVVNSITPNATSVTQGSTFSFSYVVKDIGTASAGSSWAGIYLDGQSASNELSGSAGYNSIAGIAANGGFVTASNSFGTAGLSVSQHTLWIKADYWNSSTGQTGNGNVSESNETNNWNSVTFTVTAPPHPQAAASAPSQPDASNPLTADALAPTFAAAKELWTQALGAGDPRLAILDQVKILISSLPDRLLGATTGTTIVLDSTAAGWGWFVDPTPLANSEFGIALSNGVYAATPGSPAYGHMDLLTTLIHELGNAMGFAEDQGQDVTGATLQAGVRRVPTVAAASPLPAADPPVTVPVASNLPVPNASNGFAAAQPASAGSPLTKGSLGQPIIPVAVAPAALTPGGAPAGVVVASAPVLPGIAPSWGITVGGTVSAPWVSGPVSSPDPVQSFVSLDARGRRVAEVVSEDPPVAERHSSQPSEQGGAKPTINWDNSIDGVANLSSGPAAGSPEWLDDFLNHLGQSETQRNPNAGIRLRPSPSAATSVHG